MAKLVDAPDLGSGVEICVGSSPTLGTKFCKHGIRLILFHSVLIQRIQCEFSSCGPIRGGHIRLITESSIQVFYSVSQFVWDHRVFNALVAKLVDAPDLGSGVEICVGSSPT